MMVRYTLRAAALASTCLLPLGANAADDFDMGGMDAAPAAAPAPVFNNEVTVGGQYQSQKSARFGQYTGRTDQGGYAIGGFSMTGRKDTQYWELYGDDLGLTSRSLGAKYGEQGRWGVQFDYDGIPMNRTDSFHTIYDSSGMGTVPSGLQGIAAGGNLTSIYGQRVTSATGAGSTAFANMSALAPYTNVRSLGTQRDVFKGLGTYMVPNSNWTITGLLQHEHKEGDLANSIAFNGGGIGHSNNARGCNLTLTGGNLVCTPTTSVSNYFAFAEPVNYDTDRYEAKAAFNTRRLQAALSYAFLNFTDNNSTFNAINPISAYITSGSIVSGASAANPVAYTQRAAFGLPPSNSEHQVRGSVGYAITPTTRINANLQYAVQMQNDSFGAATNDPPGALSAAARNQLAGNPSSLNGLVENYFGNIQLTSRPLQKLDLLASYTIDDRRDHTKTYNFYSPAQDNANAASLTQVATSGRASFNDQKVKLEAGYRILPETKVTFGYTFVQKNSDNGEFRGTREHAVGARINSKLVDGVDGRLGYTHSNRYGMGTFFTSQGSGTYVFFDAPRTRDEIKGELAIQPRDDMSVSLNAKLYQDHYNDVPRGYNQVAGGGGLVNYSALADAPGRRNDHNINVGPDFSYMPNHDVTTHLFYNFQRSYYGTSHANSLGLTTGTFYGSTPYSSNKTTDDTHTVGLSTDWQYSPALKLGFSYNFSYGDTNTNVTDGASLAYVTGLNTNGTLNNSSAVFYAITPLPDVKSQLHSFNVHGEYAFNPAMSLYMGYTYERFLTSDWNLYGITNNSTLGNVMLGGEYNPSYSVHLVGMALRVKW